MREVDELVDVFAEGLRKQASPWWQIPVGLAALGGVSGAVHGYVTAEDNKQLRKRMLRNSLVGAGVGGVLGGATQALDSALKPDVSANAGVKEVNNLPVTSAVAATAANVLDEVKRYRQLARGPSKSPRELAEHMLFSGTVGTLVANLLRREAPYAARKTYEGILQMKNPRLRALLDLPAGKASPATPPAFTGDKTVFARSLMDQYRQRATPELYARAARWNKVRNLFGLYPVRPGFRDYAEVRKATEKALQQALIAKGLNPSNADDIASAAASRITAEASKATLFHRINRIGLPAAAASIPALLELLRPVSYGFDIPKGQADFSGGAL